MNKLEIAEVKLSLPEVDVILQSMGQQPYDRVADLIANIRNQVITQINEANKPVEEELAETNAGGTD